MKSIKTLTLLMASQPEGGSSSPAATDDMLNMVQTDDILLLSPRQTVIPKLSQEFTALMQEEGVSLAELLQGLDEERKLIWQERYADHA